MAMDGGFSAYTRARRDCCAGRWMPWNSTCNAPIPSMMRQAGTILGTTNRGDPFAYPMPDGSRKDRSEEVIEGIRLLGLDALIGIGGDGSFAILRRLTQHGGIPFVGIPKTIDNDVGGTESFGRLSYRGDGGDRGDRSAAAHRRQPRPGDDPRGDGARQRPDRACRRHRRWCGRDPGAGDPVRHRRRRRAYQQAGAWHTQFRHRRGRRGGAQQLGPARRAPACAGQCHLWRDRPRARRGLPD